MFAESGREIGPIGRRALIWGLLMAGLAAPAVAAEWQQPGAGLRPETKALEAVFGAPSQAGFGSTVLQARAADRADLERLALAAYRYFVGGLWEKWGEAAWMGPWHQLMARQGAGDIVAELQALADPAARQSAGMILDAVTDAEAGKRALAQAFDGPSVADLLVYALGDGGAMSGLLVAARLADGDALFLVFLMD